jgi:hypothetical protein
MKERKLEKAIFTHSKEPQSKNRQRTLRIRQQNSEYQAKTIKFSIFFIAGRFCILILP